MIAYVRMLVLRWYRRPWGAGSLWSMLIIPGIVTVTIELRDLASSQRSGFELEAVLYSTTALAVGFVVFSLFVLIQEESIDGRGRALQVAGVAGVRLSAALVVFGCLISIVFAALGTGSSMLVSAAIGNLEVSWVAAGSAIALGVCTMVPMTLLTTLLLPVALSRPLVVVMAISVAWMTNSVAVEAGRSGTSAAADLGMAAVMAQVVFLALPVVWKKFPSGFWK